MPITGKDFKLGLFPQKEGGIPNKVVVLDFLKKNKDKAYTTKELIKLMPGLNVSQIRSSLTSLNQKDLVMQKYYYWMYNEKKAIE